MGRGKKDSEHTGDEFERAREVAEVSGELPPFATEDMSSTM